MVKGLLLEIAIGIGWLLFAGTTEPARSHATVVVESPEPATVDFESTVALEEPRPSPRPAEEKLEVARKARNWDLFLAALAESGAMGPEEERKRVEIAADRTLQFQDHAGELFRCALIESEVDGIGAAALLRLRGAIDRGAWADARAWSLLAARHGTALDLDALTGMLDEDCRTFRSAIIGALAAAADRADAASRFEGLLQEDREMLRHELATALRVVADANPALAYRLCRERIGASGFTRIQPIAESLWKAATGPQIQEAKGLLNNIEGELERVYGLIAILGCHRKEDRVGLEPLLDTPVSIVERAAVGEESPAIDGALKVLRGQPRLHTRRSLVALEAYLPRTRAFRRADVRKTIERMKAHLGVTITEWNPER